MDHFNVVLDRLVELLEAEGMSRALGESLPAKALNRAEARIGANLPDDFRTFYGRFGRFDRPDWQDRAGSFWFGMELLSLEAALDEWDVWQEVIEDVGDELDDECDSEPPGHIREVYACRGWVPLFSDGSGNHLALDLTPGPEGRVGQIITCGRDEEMKNVIAPDLTTFWRCVVEGWTSGRFAVMAVEEGDHEALRLASDPEWWFFHGADEFVGRDGDRSSGAVPERSV